MSRNNHTMEETVLAYALYQILQGDEGDAYEKLRSGGWVDENFEWIYEADDEAEGD